MIAKPPINFLGLPDKLNKKSEAILLFCLFTIASFFLFYRVSQHPLVDADEATYAQVVVDTMRSGDIFSLKKFGDPWFAKPPLYFWLTMPLIKIFGTNEIVFRLPSILFAILALWLIYLITKKLTKNPTAAATAFLILLFSPLFYIFSREIRMDSGVTAMMLLTLYLIILGWENNLFLLLVWPAIALGFMIKGLAILPILPILLIYGFSYKKWSWLKDKYLWLGLIISLVVAVPWHLIEYLKFGKNFLNNDFIRGALVRSISDISNSGLPGNWDYLKIPWQYNQPWTFLAFLLTGWLVISYLTKKNIYKNYKLILAPLLSALFIMSMFALIKPHFSTYLLPAMPFLAIFLAVTIYGALPNLKTKILAGLVLSIFLFIAYVNILKDEKLLIQPFHYEEKNAGTAIKKNNASRQPVYILNWPYLETISFYGDTKLDSLDIFTDGGRSLKAPFYLIINATALKYFYDDQGNFLTDYEGIKPLYRGQYLFLIHSDKNITLPVLTK